MIILFPPGLSWLFGPKRLSHFMSMEIVPLEYHTKYAILREKVLILCPFDTHNGTSRNFNSMAAWQANDNLEKTAGGLDEKFSMASWSWFEKIPPWELPKDLKIHKDFMMCLCVCSWSVPETKEVLRKNRHLESCLVSLITFFLRMSPQSQDWTEGFM